MGKTLAFSNWSLKKALATEPDSFTRARIRIIYTILLFTLTKAVMVTAVFAANEQWMQLNRSVIAFVIYTILLKVLLYRPGAVKHLAHIMVILGMLIVWSNVFIYIHKINLLTLQFVFMIVLSSFYILGSRLGLIYAVVGTAPVIVLMMAGGNVDMYSSNTPEEIVSPRI